MASASAFRKAVASLALMALFALPAAGFCQSCAAPPARPASAQLHADHCASMAHHPHAGMALLPRDCGQKPAVCSLAATVSSKQALNLTSSVTSPVTRGGEAEAGLAIRPTIPLAYNFPSGPPQYLTLRI
ncbi:MAG TPA: hypothetical protein VK657_02850 [Terriglobales bacterium]|nr:hypothetical protein [Terriglobales bacterium]